MAGQSNAVGFWLLGERPDESSSEHAPQATINADQLLPTWNNSTIYIQILRDALVEQGWKAGSSALPPWSDTESTCELPRRPLDLGVGRWR